MPERVVLIGLGGIGSQLLPSLVRYLSFRPEPRPLLVLVDGDAYEPGNRSRQLFPDDALGTNKAEALAQVFRGGGLGGRRRSPRTCAPTTSGSSSARETSSSSRSTTTRRGRSSTGTSPA